MGSTYRPNIDPSTKRGDVGIESCADDRPDTEDRAKRRPVADPLAPREEGAPIEGPLADQFLTDEDAVSARNEGPGQQASD
jgi:hypothetical protein